MKQQIHLILLFLYVGYLNPVNAQDINNLLVEGDDTLPGIVGFYENTSLFSWMHNIFPLNTSGHSWTLGPGADGGFSLGRDQKPNKITAYRLMYNVYTSFFSVNGGITIDGVDTINMANLRMRRESVITDVGAGSGYDTLVPRVADIQTLPPETNGWMLSPDNSYHILYHTVGTCGDCRLILHFYGKHIKANGDINNDGNVDIVDVLLSQRAYSGSIALDLEQKLRADVAPLFNGKAQPNGKFDIPDVLTIQRKALGLVNF